MSLSKFQTILERKILNLFSNLVYRVCHHMEIRGLGIINISQLYGVGAIRNQKEVQLIVQLEDWNSAKAYDRLGTEQK